MKYFKYVSLVILIAMSGTACKKDSTTTPAASNPVVGSWRVSSFVKDSVDITSQFNGYTFTCNANGGMTIQGNGYNYSNCNWNNNGGSNTMCHFHIMGCDDNSVLWEFDDDWDLVNHDANHCYYSNHNPNHHSTMTWIKA